MKYFNLIKKFHKSILYFLILILSLALALKSELFFIKYYTQGIVIGYGKPPELLDYQDLKLDILKSEEAIRSADEIIEDARRRGLLD